MAKSKARPNKNADGQAKKPSANPDGGTAPSAQAGAAAGAAAARAGAPPDPAVAGRAAAPSMVPPGGPPAPQAQPPAPQAAPPGAAPGQPPAPAQPQGAFTPQPAPAGQSDARSNINFKDLPPMGQAQAMSQAGLDPMAGNKMASQQLQSTLAAPQQDPSGVPNAFSGPGVPPGLENLPQDIAALHGMVQPLQQSMARGFAPGASTDEHSMALNAAALARAHAQHATGKAQAQIDHHRNKTMLAQHLAAMHAAGHLPTPEEVAQHAAAAQPPMSPQLGGSSY